jgi:putative ABC transport system permease protein
MNIWKMALRNLGRNRRRTALAVLSVFIALTLVTFMDGLISGVVDSLARNFTKNETGHVNVTTTEYRARKRFMPASAAIRDADAVVAAISSTPGLGGQLQMVTPRVQFGVVLSSGAQSKAARAIGGDPLAEKSMLMLDRAILPGGAYLQESGTALIGKRLADTLGLGVGDTLKVIAEKADYGLGFKKLRIAGLFHTGLDTFDGSTFLVSIDDARDLLGLGRGASQVLVMLKDYQRAEGAANAIRAHLAASGLTGLSVQGWSSLGDIASLIILTRNIYFWAEIIVAFLGAFIIANVVMMVVLERRREIGILLSMGMERPRIQWLFLVEGVLMGALGSAAGVIAGTALNLLLGLKGLDMTRAVSGAGIPLDNVIHPAVHPLTVAWLFVVGIAVALVVSFLPSRAAARMDPIDAIRSV